MDIVSRLRTLGRASSNSIIEMANEGGKLGMIIPLETKGRYVGKSSGILSELKIERKDDSIKLTSINGKSEIGGATLKIPISEIPKMIDALLQECKVSTIEAAIVIEGKVTKQEILEGMRLKVIYPHPTNPRADIIENGIKSASEVTQEDGEKFLGWLVEIGEGEAPA